MRIPQASPLAPRASEAVLPNGLRVVTAELPHLHTATVQLFVKVGSRYESERDNGLSHFVEHMLFRGTERYPSSYAINFAIEELGGTLDAETGRDYSMYQVTLDPALLDEGLALFGEIFGRPQFKDIDLEREIIIEEINEDYDDDGNDLCVDEIARGLVFAGHPLAHRITGPRENVERFTLDDVLRHFGRFYCARNMVLGVAGPVTAAQVDALAARHLGALPPGEEAAATSPAFSQREALYEYVQDPGSQTTVHLVLRGVPEYDPDYAVLIAMLRVIDDGMATRLHYQLCDQLGLAYSVNASVEPLHDVTLFEIEGASAHAKTPALVREMLNMLSELRDDLVTEAELDKAKRRYRYDMAASMDDAASVASWFAGTALYRTPSSFEERVGRMEAVTAEDIRRLASAVVRPDRLAVVVLGKLGRAGRAEVRDIVTTWR